MAESLVAVVRVNVWSKDRKSFSFAVTLGSVPEVNGLASASHLQFAAHQTVQVSHRADRTRFIVCDSHPEELFCPQNDLYSIQSHGIELSAN